MSPDRPAGAFDPACLRLYLVTAPDLCAALGLTETVRRAVAGGVTCVQLRDKAATTAERTAAAAALVDALAGTGVPVFVNDDLEAAAASGAQGVHLGQGDVDPATARERLGPGAIVGLSCETLDHVRAGDPGVVDYLGTGPVFATTSKADHEAPIGFEGLARLVAAAPVPCVAIGGLKARHMGPVRAAGAVGPAVVSAICGQPDPEAAARTFFSESEPE